MKPQPSEHQAQAAFITWFRWTFPGTLIFSCPNGAHIAGSSGQRAMKIAKLKAEGMLPGAPDLVVPAWRVAVEFKRDRRSRVSPEQIAVHEALRVAGWLVIVAYGLDDAIAQTRAVTRESAA